MKISSFLIGSIFVVSFNLLFQLPTAQAPIVEAKIWQGTVKAFSSSGSSSSSAASSSPSIPVRKKVIPKTPVVKGDVDLDRLAKAVSIAETSGCTLGTGRSKNNCFGIKAKGSFIVYGSKEESYAHFKDIWARKYGSRFPTYAEAQKWTGNDRPVTWLAIVGRNY